MLKLYVFGLQARIVSGYLGFIGVAKFDVQIAIFTKLRSTEFEVCFEVTRNKLETKILEMGWVITYKGSSECKNRFFLKLLIKIPLQRNIICVCHQHKYGI